VVKIKRQTLQALVIAAQNTYPHEFIALLGSTQKKSGVIDEFIVLPATFGETFSSIRLDLLPYTSGAIGSVHSHPGPSASPSRGDLSAFRAMGEIHLIIAYPFSFESTKAFDANGKQLQLEVVE
jgi:proteasome lid subunit RPN8/RPN11